MKTHQPPKLPLKLFRFYCSGERMEELEGDLYEVYQDRITEKGTRFAGLFYWWLVIRSFRPYALKRTKMDTRGQFFSLATLQHNLKMAWRNMVRRKTTTAINIVGLAIGIAGFVAIYNLVNFELSFNKHFSDRDRIYRVYSQFSGTFSGTNPAVATGIPDFIEENNAILEEAVRLYTNPAKSQTINEEGQIKDFEWNGRICLVSSSYFRVFDQYSWLAGSPSVLDEPFKVILEKREAEKYFGNTAPLDMVGRRITYQDSLEMEVAGIVALHSKTTDFNFTEFMSFSTIDKSWLKEKFELGVWNNTNSSTQFFVKLQPEVTEEQKLAMLEKVDEEVLSYEDDPDIWKTNIRLQPLAEMHYDGNIGLFDHSGSPANLTTLKVLLGIAFALLLIAVFNFINLETAQAVNKSKEVGLRKSLGVSRKALIVRFITESTLVAFIAAIFALPLSHFGLKYFGELLPEEFALNFGSFSFWASLLLLVLITGVLSGFYPAVVASSFSPIQALKSNLRFSSGKSNPQLLRKVLISAQFVFAQVLIICTMTVLMQISYVLNKDMGFQDEGVVYFYTPHYESTDKAKLLMNEISTLPEIKQLSLHNSPPARNGWSTSTMKYYDQDSTEYVKSVHQKTGDESYLDLYQIKIIAGRNIRKDAIPEETLINEAYAAYLGFEDPANAVGIEVGNGDTRYRVVGIMNDFHFQSLRYDIEPLMYRYQEDYSRCIGMSVNTAQMPVLIDKLTDHWSEFYPDRPLEVLFMDETIENFYKEEKRTSRMAGIATGIAILISALGLFGLISYTVVQKSKEIGVRKVLGASILHIGSVLTREFLILLVISFLITLPIAYYFIRNWLEGYSYQTEIQWWVYASGGLIAGVVAILSVGIKVWKASSANPVESLRYE